MHTYKVFFNLSVILILVTTLAVSARPGAAQETPMPPLAARGPYAVGERTLTFVDDSREHRKLVMELWYPAIAPTNPDKRLADLFAKGHRGWPNAVPDTAGKPYPLVLYSTLTEGQRTEGATLIEPLASHGFVVVAVEHPNDLSQASFVDRPLDLLFVLDQLAANKTGDLAGLIDTDHTGIMGASVGAYAALALTGARIDPASAKAWAATPLLSGAMSDPRNFYPDLSWDKLATYRAKFSALKSGEMWPPFTDKRMLGALLFSPCCTPLFGEHGLATATIPTLMVAGTGDNYQSYEHDAAFAYAHLGSRDRYLLTIIDGASTLSQDLRYGPTFLHFEAAFFGYYLQGHQDYAKYLTADYVNSLEAQVKLGLVWGLYTKK